jgi:hypothetical protein
MRSQTHERLESDHPLAISSDRSFGGAVGAVLCLLGARAWHHGAHAREAALLGIGTLLLFCAWLFPSCLRPLNRAWSGLGEAISRVTTPVLMGVVYFGVVTPVALARRVMSGKVSADAMRRRWQPEAPSYWIRREPPGPPPESISRQY